MPVPNNHRHIQSSHDLLWEDKCTTVLDPNQVKHEPRILVLVATQFRCTFAFQVAENVVQVGHHDVCMPDGSHFTLSILVKARCIHRRPSRRPDDLPEA
ncbi:uncharacterized protein METZ01_LOCUS256869 [marine metagenome]|uniref:Uncharacterized protein n=1 Tax=marine metagenome TaxID=408172 RepID=A0A382IX96_9ZZZZ